MVLFSLFGRLIAGSPVEHVSRQEVIAQSPLHILPAPVLIILAIGCLVLAACVAGLTLGLMSLDPLGLEIVMQGTDAKAAAAARAVKPVREQGNLLLVTLLFANTIATELLPLVLEALVPGGYFSLVVSVITIMLFGEIIPQAICSRHPLLIGSYMIGFVKVLRAILYPLTYPIAFMLDVMLGKELGTIYNREELKGLIDVHASNEVLTQDETTILKGALEFSQKTVAQILTPADNVFSLDIDSNLNRETLLNILRSGHSRIPIYEKAPNNIVCLLLVKQLVLVNPDDELPIRSLISKKKRNYKVRVAPALECTASTSISDLLNEFQKGRSHMAIVYDDISKSDEERGFTGIVSIEDIIEEILQEEIVDETDQFTDNTNTTQVLMRNPEGVLVRSTAQTSRAIHLPGTKTSVIVKEINVPALLKPLDAIGRKKSSDWKISKSKKVKIAMSSPSQPLLGNACSTDLEAGQFESDGTNTSSDSRPPLYVSSPSRPKSNHANNASMQYAKLPGQSLTSLFGEDDNVVPEDFASPSIEEVKLTVSEALKSGGLNVGRQQSCSEPNRAELKQTLQVRPLPDNASDKRAQQIPSRQRPFHFTGPGPSPQGMDLNSYGSIEENDDIGGSDDEKA